MKKGLLMVHTGEGKGKTTAALGLAFRAIGHGHRVCIIQFIKGAWETGELFTAQLLADLIEFHVMGKGFTKKSDDIKEDAAMAQKGWSMAKEKILSKNFRMVILDEMTYPLDYKMIPEAEVIEFLKNRPEGVHVVITGRKATAALKAAADMVTEMKAVKHHYKDGITSQKGIEF
jgi:cob(I)alamin adenosyltransferase